MLCEHHACSIHYKKKIELLYIYKLFMHVRVTNKLKHVGNFANLSIISATAEKNKKKVGKKSNFIYLQYYFSIIELDCCFQ